MKVLAIETATYAGGIAVLDDSRGMLASYYLATSLTHSERLMSSIELMFSTAEILIADIDAIAVSVGPGSFTGIRIGMSVAKAMAYAAKKPLLAVPTLESIAYRYFEPGHPVCPLIDARRDEVYAALFRVNNDMISLEQIDTGKVLKPQLLLDTIEQITVFSGTGAIRYRDLIMSRLGDLAHFAPPHRILPSAEEVAFLAHRRLLKGDIAEPATLEPYYIRDSDAEIKRSHNK